MTPEQLETLRTEYSYIIKTLKTNLTEDKADSKSVDVLEDLISQIIEETGDEATIKSEVLSDFSRFFTRWNQYVNQLALMPDTTSVLRKKIVGLDFFEETYHDDSNKLFKLRKWVKENIKSRNLRIKVNSHLDSILTGLDRKLKRKYGLC